MKTYNIAHFKTQRPSRDKVLYTSMNIDTTLWHFVITSIERERDYFEQLVIMVIIRHVSCSAAKTNHKFEIVIC